MELLQLRYFHEVAQTQHMTNSAKRLGVAQPALTQAIRRLEASWMRSCSSAPGATSG